jgi:iron-sulfur cluster assembly protein
MIKFTEIAREEILKTLDSPTIPEDYALRVGLKGGACSATYLLGLDKPSEYDELYEVENIKVLIDKRHLMYLIGILVDFQETEQGWGFTMTKNA